MKTLLKTKDLFFSGFCFLFVPVLAYLVLAQPVLAQEADEEALSAVPSQVKTSQAEAGQTLAQAESLPVIGTEPGFSPSTEITGDSLANFVPSELNPDFTVRMQIILDLRKIYIDDDTGSTNQIDARGSSFSLTADWRNQVRVFLKANLSHFFEYENTNKVDFNKNFKFEDFIDNAYIEFREIDDTPMAVIFGKRDLVFNMHEFTQVVPIPYTFWENYQARYDVIALTIKYADEVEFTIYEGENGEQGDNFNEGLGDFDIEEDSLGFLVRVSRDLSPSVALTASYNRQKNKHLGYKRPEEKITTGFKIEINDRVSSWVEGMFILKNPPLALRLGDKGKWGASLGLSYDISEDLTLVGSYNHIDELTRELGLGLYVACGFCSEELKDRSQLKFQVYHSEYPEQGWEKDTLYGLSWTITLDQLLYAR